LAKRPRTAFQFHDVAVVFEDADEVRPGAVATARAWALAPETLPTEMAPGFAFDFVEGHRIIGQACALDVLHDPTPFPLTDLAEAKVRPLKST
jgi:hypothetical protein